jgi:tripartite-type tricarboxylate transporter receptor subunit TctC
LGFNEENIMASIQRRMGMWLCILISGFLFMQFATAQNAYPDKPIELVVPWAAGGASDAMSRAFAEAAKKHLPQPIVVNNKPGATGSIGFGDVARAAPDGYKMGVLTAEILIIPHMGIGKVSQDDFIPIARFNAMPSAITVRAEAPWKTLEEFIDFAKRNPSAVKAGNSGMGSIWHLAAAAVGDKTGVQFNHIPFQGGNPAVLALLGGHVDVVTVSTSEVQAHVSSGKLRILAVMADRRVKGFESVPTLKERGIDVSVGSWVGLGVPKGTPLRIVETLKTVAAKSMQEPSLLETIDKMNLNASFADDTAFKAQMARDNETFRALVDKLQLKAN